jgi:glycosyltransferase involved in cell wall biosynthesis
VRQAGPVKILWISHFPVFGGPHNLALRLAEPLSHRGVETVYALPRAPGSAGSAAERLRDGGIEVEEIELGRLRSSRDPRVQLATLASARGDVRRIAELVRRHRADAVLLTGLANPHAAFAAREAGAAVIWQIADSRTPAPLRLAMMPLVRRLADTVMINGQALVASHVGSRPLHRPTFLFAGVVDTDRFRPDPERGAEARRALGVPPEALFVGTIANINPQKGIEYFVRAAAPIHAARPDARFLIHGHRYETHRSYEQMLERELRDSTVPSDRFVFTEGPPEGYYPALDVKLITSVPRSEGTTSTAMEAMACAVPVVATDVGAVAEVVEDGVTGFVVPPLDPAAIAAATLRLAGDADLRASAGEAGRQIARRRYSAPISAEVYVEALEAAQGFRARRGTG